MAVAHSIFTLDGWVQMFWADFDMPVTVVPLKVTLGYKELEQRMARPILHTYW